MLDGIRDGIAVIPQIRRTRNTPNNSAALKRIISTSSHFPHPHFTFNLNARPDNWTGLAFSNSHLFVSLCHTVDDGDNGTG